MDKQQWKTISRIFDLALTMPVNRRTTYIRQLCAGDPALQKEIDTLLKSMEESEGLLEQHLENNKVLLEDFVSHLETDPPHSDASLEGRTIDQWKLTDLLGHGGMGSVYKAERVSSDIRQIGAVKIMHRSLKTPDNVQRFKLEQQILAGLNHPNIANRIDGGVSEDGLPYLVMEYVEGKPIREYCDDHQLPVQQRLRLFSQVCQAVQFAHKNLIVHRDLKPENIMVTNQGHVKILDFGIAKLLDPDLYEFLAVETQQNMGLMSLEYAAPEQTLGEPVTTSTDLYALGLLLYELLAGVHPFVFKDKSYQSVIRIIREEFPSSPSRKLQHLSDPDLLSEIAASRSIRSSELIKTLKGDLDAIILKALRKEPDERYDTIGELLLDIDAFLQKKPVRARSDSIRYRTNKFCRRHKTGIVAAITFLITLGTIVTYFGLRLAEERDIAQQEAQKAQQAKNFMLDIFEVNNPAIVQFENEGIEAGKLLAKGIKVAEEKLSDQPDIYIEVLQELGFTLTGLNAFKEAQEAYNKALQKSLQHNGLIHPQTSQLYRHLADFNNKDGKLDTAEVLINQAISIDKRVYGEFHSELAKDYHIYGKILRNTGDYLDAKKYLQKAERLYLESGQETSTSRFVNLFDLGMTLTNLGDYDKAETLLLRVLKREQKLYKEPHIHIAATKQQLGNLYKARGNHQKAESFLLEALDMQRTLLGDTHSFHIGLLQDLTGVELAQNKLESAEKYAKEAVRISRELYGEDNTSTLRSLDAMALVKTKKGLIEEAKPIYRKVIRKKRQLFGNDSASLAVALYNYGLLLHENSEHEEALPLFREVIEIDKKSLGKQSPDVAVDLNKLAALQRDMGNFAEAETSFVKAQVIFEEKFPDDHYRTAEFWVDYGRLKLHQQEFKTARDFLEKGLRIFTKRFGDHDERTNEAARYLKRAEAKLTSRR